MSKNEAIEQNLRLVPVWQPVIASILAAIFTAGMVYGVIKSQNDYQDSRLLNLEVRVRDLDVDVKNDRANIATSLKDISNKLGNIEGRLNGK